MEEVPTLNAAEQLKVLRDRRLHLDLAMRNNRDKVASLESAYVTMLKENREAEVRELQLMQEAVKIVPTDILK